ncbi:MAG: serine/threonine-protein kinase [Chloroflexales bacterium]
MQLAPNDLLQSRYRVQALIAQGGMGAVYRAVDERLGNTVALKQTLMSDPLLRAAFEREARLLAGLHHPALPVVSDHFTEGDGEFLVMQFIPGDDLAMLLRNRGDPFPLDEVLPWADRLLDALDYLHTQRPPVIHRDLKPQNLKLTPRGEVILLDFGLAKGALASGSAAGGRSIFGYTPQYAPLEQIQGAGTDPRSDLYAFAATVYELLTGAAPTDALARAAALVAGQPDPLRPAHHLRPQIPAALGDLLQATMAQDPAQRPASAAALRALLPDAARAPAAPPTMRSSPAASSAGQPTIALARQAGTPTLQAAPRSAGSVRWAVGTAAALGLGLLVAAILFVLNIVVAKVVDTQGGSATPAPRPTAAVISTTAGAGPPPEPAAGGARSTPLPPGATAQIGSWTLVVTGVSRGDEAWSVLHETNSNNSPAPAGQEYVIVHVRAQTPLDSITSSHLYPKLTGDKLVAYLPVAAVTPRRMPDEYAVNSGDHEVDFPYLVATGEGNLMLQAEDQGGLLSAPPVFVALDAGAALRVDPALRAIKPTTLGADLREPAALNQNATTEDYEVTVREVLRGDAAYTRLLEANPFNKPPPKGIEYLLARVEVRSIATKDETVMVSGGDFYSVQGDAADPAATALRYASLVEPEPRLEFYLYPGGRAVGWVAVEVPTDTPHVRLAFGPSFNLGNQNTRYFTIE